MSGQPKLEPAALDAAFARAAEQVADGTAPFVVLAVANREGLVRAEAFAGPAAPGLDVDAICLLASITKPFVATGIMQLVAEGHVGLTDGIEVYVPEFAAPGKPQVTVWHLLSQTSGVADFDLEGLLRSRAGRADLVRMAATAPIGFVPGSRYEYVSSTFDLLAAVIEHVTGETLGAYLRRTVWGPLGMADTTFDPWDRRARVAPFAIALPAGSPRPWLPDDRTEDELRAFGAMELAGAGLFSNARDLVRFGRAMLRGGELDGARILAPVFVELMTREQTTDGIGSAADPLLAEHYALGWGKPHPRTSPASPSAFGHGGATGTRLWIDPRRDLVVVYLTGVWGYPARPIDMALQAVYAALPGPDQDGSEGA
jgi:CubicO group peptidase (beta-lactamase class C family)